MMRMLWCGSEQDVEQTVELSVIWRHGNGVFCFFRWVLNDVHVYVPYEQTVREKFVCIVVCGKGGKYIGDV